MPCLLIQLSSLECRCDFAIIRRKVISAHPPSLRFTWRKANWWGHFFKLLRHSDSGDKLSWVGRGRRNLPSPFFCVFFLAYPFRATLHSRFALMTSQISCPCCLTQTLNKTRIRSLYGKVKSMFLNMEITVQMSDFIPNAVGLTRCWVTVACY